MSANDHCTSDSERPDVDRSGAVCYGNRCGGDPTHRVRWEHGERWYGICEGCAEAIPLTRGTVLDGLTPETITMHPVATDGGTQKTDSEQLELEYTLDDSNIWSGDILEEIVYFVETEHELLPPKNPRIKVTIEILEEDDCRPPYTADVIEEEDQDGA